MSELPLDAAGRRRPSATLPQVSTPAARRATRDALPGRPNPRPRRSSRSCAALVTRARSPTAPPDGQLDHLAPDPRLAADRAAVLRCQRPHPRTPVRARRRPLAAAARRQSRAREAVLRPAPAPPRARGRDGPRGRAADRHPAPARPRQPRHHLDLPRGIETPGSSTPSTRVARRWSPYTGRSRRDAATGGGEADDFLAAGPRPDRQPETPQSPVAPQSAPIIAKQQPR
jgi:hypothetical protein